LLVVVVERRGETDVEWVRFLGLYGCGGGWWFVVVKEE
jgi:hypothetical protein